MGLGTPSKLAHSPFARPSRIAEDYISGIRWDVCIQRRREGPLDRVSKVYEGLLPLVRLGVRSARRWI
jgi:hypothetical protein